MWDTLCMCSLSSKKKDITECLLAEYYASAKMHLYLDLIFLKEEEGKVPASASIFTRFCIAEYRVFNFKHVFQNWQKVSFSNGNFRIFLSFRFCVKSTLENFKVLKLPFFPILGSLSC